MRGGKCICYQLLVVNIYIPRRAEAYLVFQPEFVFYYAGNLVADIRIAHHAESAVAEHYLYIYRVFVKIRIVFLEETMRDDVGMPCLGNNLGKILRCKKRSVVFRTYFQI